MVDPVSAPVTEAVAESAAPELGYTVAVDAFSGPLDLLLFLVRKSELDIIDIPVATITDQFVAMVAAWQRDGDLDLEGAGDFILMAATLLEIKARAIAPPPVDEGDSASEDDNDLLDPRADLISKLLAYRRFKEAVGLLLALEAGRAQRVTRQLRELIPEDPDEATGIDLGDLHVDQLSKWWYTLQMRIGGGGPRTVLKDDLPIEGSIRKLTARAEAERLVTLRQLFVAEDTLQGRISMLMATLECTRQRIVTAAQPEQYGEVSLTFREEADRVIVPQVFAADEVKKRRRRPPLVTFQARVAPTQDEQEDAPEVVETEEKHETDEERFLRELNEACDLDGVLARVIDVEKGFLAYWEELHPTPPPPAVVMSEPVAVAVELLTPANIPEPLAIVAEAVVEQAVVEQAVVEQAVVEQAVVEQAVVKQAVVEQAVVEQAVVEQAVVEQVVAEQAVVAQPTPEVSDVSEAAAPVHVSEHITEPVAEPAAELATSIEPAAPAPVVPEFEVVPEPTTPEPHVEPAAELTAHPATLVEDAAIAAVMPEPEALAQLTEVPENACAAQSVKEPAVVESTAIAAVAPEPAALVGIAEITHVENVADLTGDPAIVAEPCTAHEPIHSIPDTLARQAVEVPLITISVVPGTHHHASGHSDISTLPYAVSDDSHADFIEGEPALAVPETVADILQPTAAAAEPVEVQPTLVVPPPDLFEPPANLHVDAVPALAIPEVIRSAAPTVSEAEPVVQVLLQAVAPAPAPAPAPTLAPATPASAAARPTTRRPLSRTLLFLLAIGGGATLATWWSLDPLAKPSEPLPPTPAAVTLQTTPAAVTLETTSAAVRIIPWTSPSGDFLELLNAPTSRWSCHQMQWPVVVPWTACLQQPETPTSIYAFSAAPTFTELPVSVFAVDDSWRWCASGAWVSVPAHMFPASAWIPDLMVPPLENWAVTADLRSVPVVTFAVDLGWAAFCHPAPRWSMLPDDAWLLPLTIPLSVTAWATTPDLRAVPVSTFARELGWTVLCAPVTRTEFLEPVTE